MAHEIDKMTNENSEKSKLWQTVIRNDKNSVKY